MLSTISFKIKGKCLKTSSFRNNKKMFFYYSNILSFEIEYFSFFFPLISFLSFLHIKTNIWHMIWFYINIKYERIENDVSVFFSFTERLGSMKNFSYLMLCLVYIYTNISFIYAIFSIAICHLRMYNRFS